jgi:hypothetical protein
MRNISPARSLALVALTAALGGWVPACADLAPSPPPGPGARALDDPGPGSRGVPDARSPAADPTTDPRPSSSDSDEACAPIEARIVEVLYDPPGIDGDHEFVEIAAAPGASAQGLLLRSVDGETGRRRDIARLEGRFDAHGLLVAGGVSVESRSDELSGVLPNGPDGLELVACADRVLDSVAWGAGSAAPGLRPGEALAWCSVEPAGWWAAAPSPGAFDTAAFTEGPCAAAACAAAGAVDLRLNEVFFDPVGPDGAGEAEFVELVGAPGTRAGGVRLEGHDGDRDARWLESLVLDAELDADGVLVVGGAAAGASLALPVALQNGPDALVLRGCDGAVLDSVAWGDWPGPIDPPRAPSPVPGEGRSLCRPATDATWSACSPSPGDRVGRAAEAPPRR